ncbi:hypothetical protein RRG08_042114 [Elysia crispata]|uniref:Secreted protein n=1 Tax=Elysia crispata TaxID=231223 RepID=A0AAE0Z137_9GAST|nr:hypothetical protein RRG08_042114 [Elysia crispata]
MWRLAILSYDIVVLRCTTLYCEHIAVPSGHRQRSVSSERGTCTQDETWTLKDEESSGPKDVRPRQRTNMDKGTDSSRQW